MAVDSGPSGIRSLSPVSTGIATASGRGARFHRRPRYTSTRRGRLGELARAELAALVGTHRSALEWTPDGQHPFELNVPDKHTGVTTEVAYNGGSIVVEDSRPIIPEGEDPEWVVCEPEVRIELDVGIRSDDGMIDAALTLEYVSTPFTQQPEMTRELSLADLSDTLEIHWEGQPVPDPLELDLWVVVGPGGWLYAEGDGRGPVARWWPQ